MAAPIETKVKAATAAAAIAAFITGWIVLKVPALAGLNDAIEAVLLGVVTAIFTAVAGWWAKHTPRPASRSELND